MPLALAVDAAAVPDLAQGANNRDGGGSLADKSSMAKSRALDPISKSYSATVQSSELVRDEGGGEGDGDCDRPSAGELPGRGESRASSNGDEGAS
jgi:hypothetical protein